MARVTEIVIPGHSGVASSALLTVIAMQKGNFLRTLSGRALRIAMQYSFRCLNFETEIKKTNKTFDAPRPELEVLTRLLFLFLPWHRYPHILSKSFAHCCQEKICSAYRSVEMFVIPAKAGRNAKRRERPKGGLKGMSEANHPAASRSSKALDPGFRRDDGFENVEFPGKF